MATQVRILPGASKSDFQKIDQLRNYQYNTAEERNMRNKTKAKISYEPEADVLMWEITDKSIDFAKEIGNIVVHFTKNNIPVLIEILEASKFLAKAKNLVKRDKISIKKSVLATR